jgi:hypothetical protein
VMLVCKHCGKRTRVSHRDESGTKVRICRRCGGEV